MVDLDALPVKPSVQQSQELRKAQLQKWEQSDVAKCDPNQDAKIWCVKFPLQLLFLSACENGDVEYANELLNSGVDINAKNCDGLAALHQVCLQHCSSII